MTKESRLPGYGRTVKCDKCKQPRNIFDFPRGTGKWICKYCKSTP